MDGRVWVPCWEDNHTRACVLCLPVTDILGFSWLKSLVKSLCGDRFSNPFKDLRPFDTDCAPESPIPMESEAEEESDSDQSISNATSDAKTFLHLVRFDLYLFDAVDLLSVRILTIRHNLQNWPSARQTNLMDGTLSVQIF